MQKIRVLLAKPGLDGHDRGAKVMAQAMKDAGLEVIYTGLHQSPEMIVNTAVQEDVDVVALSVLSGAHMTHFTSVKKLMEKNGLGNVLLTGGGIISKADSEKLEAIGTGKLFGPGTTPQIGIDYIVNWVKENRQR